MESPGDEGTSAKHLGTGFRSQPSPFSSPDVGIIVNVEIEIGCSVLTGTSQAEMQDLLTNDMSKCILKRVADDSSSLATFNHRKEERQREDNNSTNSMLDDTEFGFDLELINTRAYRKALKAVQRQTPAKGQTIDNDEAETALPLTPPPLEDNSSDNAGLEYLVIKLCHIMTLTSQLLVYPPKKGALNYLPSYSSKRERWRENREHGCAYSHGKVSISHMSAPDPVEEN